MAGVSHPVVRRGGLGITDLASLEEALKRRMDRFDACGCRASDHGLDKMIFVPAERSAVDAAIKKRLAGEALTEAEGGAVKTALLLFCAGEYAKRGWVMQLHYGCKRDNNTLRYDQLGPDTGWHKESRDMHIIS